MQRALEGVKHWRQVLSLSELPQLNLMVAATHGHVDGVVDELDTWLFEDMDSCAWESSSFDYTSLLKDIDGFYASIEEGSLSKPSGNDRDGTDTPSGRTSILGIGKPQRFEDERRQDRLRRHRESMSRLRRDRRETVRRLQAREQSLHQKLHRVLASHGPNANANQPRIMSLATAYKNAVVEAERLQQHNYALDEELHRRRRYTNLLQSEIQRIAPSTDSGAGTPDSTTACASQGMTQLHGGFASLDDSDLLFPCEAETLSSCTRANDHGLRLLDETRRILSDSTEVNPALHCLGWDTQRLVVGGASPILHFRFSRIIVRGRTSIKHLEDKTWAMLHSPTELSRMYGSVVECKYVHCVSQDAFILLRNSPVRENHKRFRYYNLNTRVRSPDAQSTTIAMLIMDKRPRHSPGAGVTWLGHGGASLRFSNVEGDAVEIEYVGTIRCQNQVHAMHLIMESCASLMRWEHMAVPPRLLL